MNKIIKSIRKNFSKKSNLIIAGIVVFVLILPNFVYALSGSGIMKAAFRWMANLIIKFFGLLLRLAGTTFEAVLQIGFKNSLMNVAKIGWEVSRDFANMLFILFMIIVAFATILRVERYGAKQLLPRIIIIALLINFSLVICAIIIDFSNLTADIFINNTNQANTDAGKKDIASTIVDGLQIASALTPQDCKAFDDKIKLCDQKSGEDKDDCIDEATLAKIRCESKMQQANTISENDNLLDIVSSAILGSIVIFIAAFSLFAGAILLLIRIVAIWFLVILSPIVFICYILPGLRPYWEKWWRSFINWCIFAPAFAFFIWLAARIITERRTEIETAFVGGSNSLGSSISGFFSVPGILLNYLLIIGILIGGLITAKQLGIYGANMAIGIGKKMAGGAKDWAKEKATRGLAKPGEWVSGKMGAAMNVPVLGRALRALPGMKQLAQAPAAAMTAERKRIGEERKKLERHSNDTLKDLFPTFNKSQKMAASQILATRKDLKEGRNLREKDIIASLKMANRYGDDQVKEILANRPSLAPEVGKSIEEATKKINPAKVDSVQSSEFQNPAVVDAMLKNWGGGHMAKLDETNREGLQKIQDAIYGLGADRTARETALNTINPKLKIYIDNTALKATGILTYD